MNTEQMHRIIHGIYIRLETVALPEGTDSVRARIQMLANETYLNYVVSLNGTDCYITPEG